MVSLQLIKKVAARTNTAGNKQILKEYGRLCLTFIRVQTFVKQIYSSNDNNGIICSQAALSYTIHTAPWAILILTGFFGGQLVLWRIAN
tara:strand:+ start:286 stop:552 length:267 start_codon:yes stop_codon:yes gene_type:complete